MKQSPLSNSALLVIDMQRYFLEKGAPAFLNPPDALLKNVKSLVDAFRREEKLVVFTRHAHKKGEPLGQMGRWWDDDLPFEGNKYSDLTPKVKLEDDDIIITKTRYSALEGTGLLEILRDKGVDTVVICGVMTNVCVETTARDAFMKDFQPIVVDDACAGKGREYHAASILNLSYAFAVIETTQSVIAKLRRGASRP
jgi:nicotinamidase-related amidase